MLKDNWLNTVSSGTYKFTFMIVDTDTHNAATEGSFNKEQALAQGKAVIVAEDGVESAYAVQNVNIISNTASIKNGHATATKVTFDLIEPLGFGFLDRSLTVGGYFGMNANIQQLKWVLQLDFLGRDPVTGASVTKPNPFFYALALQGMTGTLGEAGAKYYMEFTNMDSEAMKETVTKSDITVKNVTTVKTFAEELEITLNNAAKKYQPVGNPVDIEQGFADAPPLINYKVKLAASTTTQAQDYFGIASFNLADAPWAGTANSANASGQSESLELLGTREITINNETQLSAAVRDEIGKNTPTFTEHNNLAQRSGITYDIMCKPTAKLINEVDKNLNVQRKEITLTISIVTSGETVPPDGPTIENLRNSAAAQNERFNRLIVPRLVKKYTYQYTGENTEVMDIDLSLNSTFYTALSPAAAIYYADNNNMFEANLIQQRKEPVMEERLVTDGPAGQSRIELVPANTEKDSGTSAVKFLSDVPLQKYNINQSPVFGVQPMGAQGQQVNEMTDIDTTANMAIMNYAARIKDTQDLRIEARGDPIFLGQNGTSIFDINESSVYMAFINFQPNPEDLLINQQKGPIDMLTTGVYKINEVISKFQQGSFTQTVSTYRDQNSSTFLLLDTLLNLRVD
jgi:hypothetical protein